MHGNKVEQGVSPKPDVQSVSAIDRASLASMIGGKLTGGELSFYGGDLFIQLSGGGLIDFAGADPWDAYETPRLLLNGSRYSLIDAMVVEKPSGASFVRATDTQDNHVFVEITDVVNGAVSHRSDTLSLEHFAVLGEQEAEAAALSLSATRQRIQEEGAERIKQKEKAEGRVA